MTETLDPAATQLSLGTAAARQLASTTKSAPQMQAHHAAVAAALAAVGGGQGRHLPREPRGSPTPSATAGSSSSAPAPRSGSSPPSSANLPPLRGFDDADVLPAHGRSLHPAAVRRRRRPSCRGRDPDRRGCPDRARPGREDRRRQVRRRRRVLGTLADGDYFGAADPDRAQAPWDVLGPRGHTGCIVLTSSPRTSFAAAGRASRAAPGITWSGFARHGEQAQNKHGEAAIELASGHAGETDAARHVRGLRPVAARVRAQRRADRAARPHPRRRPLQRPA